MAIAPLHDRRQAEGDRQAIEYMRFTREEHERGDTAGWRFEVGWYVRASCLRWAWFSRDCADREG